ncbi:response regulator [Sphingobacterium oryzagri]|uniref:Response regulator n=1 Tax=Sphingobacterium oryzagri TaxID=3025669 RepID=A0ABY7WMA6_9SPHI|nr:response regulator [Sphingobacterium sp. KACC 22765]WDF70732.1 response regulator [Sphingobacterium sp. KACC 22765]
MVQDKSKVVICDDDDGILSMLEMIVESTGASVETESNSAKLLPRLENSQPALLIIDLWMPNMPGDAIVRRLREQEKYNDVYILCISASVNGQQVAMEAGADKFIAKPFDIYDVLSVVQDVVKLDGVA